MRLARSIKTALVVFASFGVSLANIPVLGYVTPWNPRGKQLVDDFRKKFDIVSPVWYAVAPDPNPAKVYKVDGGPSAGGDVDWYRRLQEPKPRPVLVTPRFILDGWGQDDYTNLIFNQTRAKLLAKAIWHVVDAMSYDGIVFESAATHALAGALTPLSILLHAKEKILTLVMPPVRPETAVVLKAVPLLASITDYFNIMTYDMTGTDGQRSSDMFPDRSPLQSAKGHGQLRIPGPNTGLDWIQDNLKAFSKATEGAQPFDMLGQFQFAQEISSKFLMGLPLYGYTYPVMFGSLKTGKIIPEKSTPKDTAVLLRASGKPITAVEIEAVLEAHGSSVQKDPNGEYFIDYSEDDGHWRAYIPTAKSTSATIKSLNKLAAKSTPVGIALWEVGQASKELLEAL
ncbi:hypothetical protein F5Y16DRAFT_157273 [Xylariaceae sp. FL0255]|nr:hypothetical protein F5Y16DRAFT_157273 [Xylariaceae sp. FL0255]